MKIPTYRPGNVGGTTQLPGVSFSGRKSVTAAAQAELNKVKPLLTGLDAVNQFAIERNKMLLNTEYNESLLGAKSSLQSVYSSLLKDTDIKNVMDGENKWQRATTDVKNRLMDNIQSRSARNKFSIAFDNYAFDLGFDLRGKIDTKIIDREKAAFNTKLIQTDNELSNVNGDTNTYDERMIEIDSDLKNSEGRYNTKDSEQKINNLKSDIAKNVAQEFVLNDLSKALEVNNTIKDIIRFNNGEITEEQIIKPEGNTEYLLHVLKNVPNEQLLFSIAEKTLKNAENEFDLKEKANKNFENTRKKDLKKAENYMLTFPDDGMLEVADFGLMGLHVTNKEKLDLFFNGKINGRDAKKLIEKKLRNEGFLTITMQKNLEELNKDNQDNYENTFAENDVDYELQNIRLGIIQGTYTLSMLLNDPDRYRNLSYPTFNTLKKEIIKQQDNNVKYHAKQLKSLFEADIISDSPSNQKKITYNIYNRGMSAFEERIYDASEKLETFTSDELKNISKEIIQEITLEITGQLGPQLLDVIKDRFEDVGKFTYTQDDLDNQIDPIQKLQDQFSKMNQDDLTQAQKTIYYSGIEELKANFNVLFKALKLAFNSSIPE